MRLLYPIGVILLKISLDANTFGVVDFIDWLVLNKNELEIHLSIIAALKVYHWYNLRGLSKDEFQLDIDSFNPIIDEVTYNNIFNISTKAKNARLRFKHHARDYIIGSQAELAGTTLLTYNLKHFEWVKDVEVMTPDDFILLFEQD